MNLHAKVAAGLGLILLVPGTWNRAAAQSATETKSYPVPPPPALQYAAPQIVPATPMAPAPYVPGPAAAPESVRPSDLLPLQNSIIRLQGQAMDVREDAARFKEQAELLQRDQRQLGEGIDAMRAEIEALRSATAAAKAPQAAPDGSWQIPLNLVWVLICGFLVMLMQAGFAFVETGFTREKNAAHTMAMNFMVFSLGMLGYWACGFAIMFGGTGAPESVSTVGTLGPEVGTALSRSIGFSVGDAYIGLAGNAGYFLSGEAFASGIFAANTMLAGAAGAVTSMATTWFRFRRPDPSFMCNGLLAGLVSITAPCAFVEAWSAVLIGAVAGILVVASAVFIEEHLRIDDPVGAVSVHGTCGLWGTVALGLFANGKYGAGWNSVGAEVYLGEAVQPGVFGGVTGLLFGDPGQLVAQIIGAGTCLFTAGVMAFALFGILGVLFGNRSDPVEERAGIDIPELGTVAYPRETGLRA